MPFYSRSRLLILQDANEPGSGCRSHNKRLPVVLLRTELPGERRGLPDHLRVTAATCGEIAKPKSPPKVPIGSKVR